MKLTGKTFGIYEIHEQLGRGGMGTVFKAYDPTLDRFVALKVLPAQLARDESFVTRFQQEARALAKLRHPHLIHIYAVGESEGYNYFAMELLDGQDLAAILRSRQTLPAKVAVHLLEQRGHTVVVANNGVEAVAALKAPDGWEFDLILMDVQMPEMDGLEATATIREAEKSRGGRIPIVAMTASVMKDDREQCLAAGMDGFLAKPIHKEEFYATVEAMALSVDDAGTNPALAVESNSNDGPTCCS